MAVHRNHPSFLPIDLVRLIVVRNRERTEFSADEIKSFRRFMKRKANEIERYVHARFGFDPQEFKIRKRISFDARRVCSYGGLLEIHDIKVPYIDISAEEVLLNDSYHEYGLIENHPVIGNFSGTCEQHATALLCHEIAHCVEYSLSEMKCSDFAESLLFKYGCPDLVWSDHSGLWQAIYSELRTHFLPEFSKIT